MPYQQASIPVNAAHAEQFSDALMAAGALSAAIEDAYAGTDEEQAIFGEPGEETGQIWQRSRVIALFDERANVAAAVSAAAAECRLDVPEYHIEQLPEQDWVRLTQSQFDPIRISGRLWIVPTWHDIADQSAVNLRLDPGLAFGTGSHPTTRLCLQWLDENIQAADRVLDYGCGSGILAIAALKLGAAAADGVDIDEQAIAASRSNARQNEAAARFFLPDDLPKTQQYDVVVANILANPLRLLGGMLAARTKAGGRIVLSGILAEQAQELGGIYSEWFDMQPAAEEGGWVRLTGVRKAE
ncbi:50S ribosomal protein L11 methyltransferase [Eikenella sp. Marseille-P7795]|uniref:50S ribosomal protein L11 methyltransferase n=1 Tax=Eikenella sp. Marseille-P7795 TaxID=2866577 RepID=UPI001CE44D68|nr:50S ribosomal protein L11 methyltransferase [Eikenella sp. Marseille-P7795]